MVDQPHEFGPETVRAHEDRDRRSFTRVIVAVIVIALIVLVLLLVRRYGAGDATPSASNGGKTIESVNGLDPEPGTVSVWIAEGDDVNTLLGTAGVSATDVVSMGGGRYVIAVAQGSETDAVARLVKVEGVIDAGLVYATGDTQ